MIGPPKGWKNTTIENIVSKIVGGGTPSKSNKSYFNGDFPFMTVKDMKAFRPKDTIDKITEDAIENSSSNIIDSNTLIISTRMGLGKIVAVDFPVAINQDLKALYLPKEIDKRFFEFQYRSQSKHIESLGTGTTVKGIRLDTLKSLEFMIPPLNEQTRIANKLDSLLAKVEQAQTRLEKIPTLLKRFRQSVLSAATSGELTREWRTEHSIDSRFESIKFEELLVELRNGLSPKPNEKGLGFPILRISSVRSGRLNQKDVRHFECDEKVREKYRLKIGDLLFTRYNGSLEFVGVCAKLKELNHEILLYPDKLVRARITKNALPQYIELFFSSPEARKSITDCVKTTSGQKGISGQDIKSQIVLCPSLDEQKEIVRRVESLFTLADTVEKQYQQAKQRTDRLTQSILAKAFRGELVPQDPNDEPASELLKRIQAEREAQKPKKKTRPKKVKT